MSEGGCSRTTRPGTLQFLPHPINSSFPALPLPTLAAADAGAILPGLPAVCQQHGTPITPLPATRAQFAAAAPRGGCGLPCKEVLPCGHLCPLPCHASGHADVRCTVRWGWARRGTHVTPSGCTSPLSAQQPQTTALLLSKATHTGHTAHATCQTRRSPCTKCAALGTWWCERAGRGRSPAGACWRREDMQRQEGSFCCTARAEGQASAALCCLS